MILEILIIAIVIVLMLVMLVYYNQDRLIFHPVKLSSYTGPENCTDRYFEMEDGIRLHGVLYKAEDSKGLVFYLHGNSGNIAYYEGQARTYTTLGYDSLFLDYRSFGKSEGNIQSEQQIYDDVQTVYDRMLREYDEDRIIVTGYSIGTGIAAYLASRNNPKMLVLEAPYYSLAKVIQETVRVPEFLIRFKIPTHSYLQDVDCKVVLITGDRDTVIPPHHTEMLYEICKRNDVMYTIPRCDHANYVLSPVYHSILKHVLT